MKLKIEDITANFQNLVEKITPSYRVLKAAQTVLVITGIIGVVSFGAVFMVSEALKGHDRAYANLKQFSAQNGLIAGTCNQWDTNNDGNISCTATDKTGKFMQLECGSNWLTADTGSCNLPKLRLQNYGSNSTN